MRKYIVRILCISMLFALCSCSEDNWFSDMRGQHISLQINASAVATKATQNGVTRMNENKIVSVYYFLYKKDVSNQPSVLNGYFANVNLDGDAPSKTFDIPVSAADVLNNLFPSGVQKCHAVVIANPPSSAVSFLEGNPSYDDLCSKIITAEFDSPTPPENFVMFYDGEVSLASRTAKTAATVNADLKRIADKFTFKVNITSSYLDTSTGKTYVPIPESANVTLMNGINKTNLVGDFELLSSVHNQVTGADYFESVPIYLDQTGVNDYERSTSKALYSYPMKWDFTDPYEPFILFELRWKEQGASGNGTPYYYKMMFSFKELASNEWYKVIANLDILGSLERTAPLVMYTNATYKILDWKDAYDSSADAGSNVNADIKDARYLVVDQTEYTIHDQDKLSIPFSSSHECVVEVTAKKYNPSSKTYSTSVSSPENFFSISNGMLEMNHELHNDIDANLDIAPYKFDILLKHSDDANYFANITVIQYPAIYITVEQNSDSRNSNKGYVYVNNSNDGAGIFGGSGQFGGVNGRSNSGDNSSDKMTVITIGRLPSNSTYILGDPRTSVVDNLNNFSSASANTVYQKNGSKRQLKYYYSTDDQKQSYIAPSIRSTSAYGRLSIGINVFNAGLSYSDAKKRCATYQEDGYPAGRWRLPTYSEVQFLVSLSNLGFIETLFYGGQSYWYAGGYVSVDNINDPNSSTTGNKRVRCVYDEWYWKEVDNAFDTGVIKTSTDGSRSTSPKTFYWGDIDRSSFNFE